MGARLKIERGRAKPFHSLALWERVGVREAELAAFEKAHQEWLAIIRALPPNGVSQEFVNPNTHQRISALELVLGRIEHEVHHRAQISTYLRMLGEQWPSPYGKLP